MKSDFLFVKHDKKLTRLAIQEIVHIEGMDDYIKFVLESGSALLVRKTMTAILKELAPHKFIRVHKSFIIPLKKLESVSATAVIVAGKEIPLSRTLKSDVISAFTGSATVHSGTK